MADSERITAKARLAQITKHLNLLQLGELALLCSSGATAIPESIACSLSLSERFFLHELLHSRDGRAWTLEVTGLAH